MIYYYIFRVQYTKGKQHILVDYLVSFAEIGDFIHYLENKHKDNYTIYAILDYHRYRYNNFKLNKGWKYG